MSEGPQNTNQPPEEATTDAPGRFVPLAEASSILMLSTDAIRGRIKRNSLRSERRDGGVYVWISDDDWPQPADDQTRQVGDESNDRSELVEVLREQVEYLQDQLDQERRARTEERRRQDGIIAGLAQRIPAIEPPEEPEPAESVMEAPGRDEARPEPERSTQKRSWWQRMFGE